MAGRPKKMSYKQQVTDGFPIDLAGYLDNEARLGYEFIPPVYSIGGNRFCILLKRRELGKPEKPIVNNQ